jgi:hypothetical protein
MPVLSQPSVPSLRPPVRKVFPGVRGKTKQEIHCDGAIIPAGQDVVIQPLGEGKYQLTTFKKDDKESHLPEGQRNIIADKSYTTIGTIHNANDVFKFDEHYQATSSPVFPNADSPSLSELKQSQIPDCFLLAGIQSVLNTENGKEFLRNMIKQNDDGTITVRLYNPENFRPESIIVPAAVLTDEYGRALNNHKALWVHALENAYVAMQAKQAENGLRTVDASFATNFAGGGNLALASKILTGTDVSVTMLTPPPSPWKITASQQTLLAKVRPFEYSEFIREVPDATQILRVTSEVMKLQGTEEENKSESFKTYAEYVAFYENNKATCDNIMNNSVTTDADKIHQLIDLGASENVQRFLVNTLNYEHVRTGELSVRRQMESFKGYYSDSQLKIYDHIKDSLAHGEILGAGTSHEIEMSIPGIVGGHAYSLLNVVERDEKSINPVTKEEVTVPVRYVQVKNPWGTYGRSYAQSDGVFKANQTDKDIFEVELSDFCKYFTHVNSSKNAAQRIGNELGTQKLQDDIQQQINKVNPQNNPSLQDLVSISKEMKGNLKNDILELEQKRFNAITPTSAKETFAKRMNSARIISNGKSIVEILNADDVKKDFAAVLQSQMSTTFKSNERFQAAEQYIETQEGQQLLRCYKLDYLERKADKTAAELQEIESLKEAIVNNTDDMKEGIEFINESTFLYKQNFEGKMKEFNAIQTEMEQLASNPATPDNLLFDKFLQLNQKFTELDVMHQSLKELDPSFSSESFNIAQKGMASAKDTVAKIETYNSYVVKNELDIANLLQQAADSYKNGQLDQRGKNTIEEFAKNPKPQVNDMHQMSHDSKMPSVLKGLMSGIYRLKNAISNLASDIKNSIKSTVSLLRGQNYMLNESSSFDKKMFGANKENAAPGNSNNCVNAYKRFMQIMHGNDSKPPVQQNETEANSMSLHRPG